jgi:hypothetical protein
MTLFPIFIGYLRTVADCVMYNWVMVNNELERCGRKQLSSDVKYRPGMYLEELKKT